MRYDNVVFYIVFDEINIKSHLFRNNIIISKEDKIILRREHYIFVNMLWHYWNWKRSQT